MISSRILFFCCLIAGSFAYANVDNHKFSHPFYAGVTGGYGWTTWQGLVPPESKQNLAMAIFTPESIDESGGLWGLFAGYEFLPYFALEAAYTRYPNAKITFDEESIFTFEHDERTSFITKTETLSLIAKIMMMVPRTDVRIYSGLGLAEMHRCDEINDHWIGTPTFNAGVNYNFTDHIMGEFGANYTAGKGISELSPVDDYFPFIYSIFLRVAYRF